MKKYSRQRELILNSLKERTDHPTAEKLYMDLKKEMPEIGIATIYRNLGELCTEGKILKIKSKTGPDRFDGNITPHIHFECESCGEIKDIFLYEEKLEELKETIQKLVGEINAKSSSFEISITGLCKKCK